MYCAKMILWNDFILPDLNLANVKEELIWRTLETGGLCNSFANRELNLIEKIKTWHEQRLH